MTRYDVKVTAQANVSTLVTVYVKTEEEANKLALENAYDGNVTWNYDGVIDNTIELGL